MPERVYDEMRKREGGENHIQRGEKKIIKILYAHTIVTVHICKTVVYIICSFARPLCIFKHFYID